MDIQHLIKMANQIGAYFQAEPDRAAALAGIAGHIKRFWDPRMRKQIVDWVEQHAGEGLSDAVLEAIRRDREQLAG
jgi:formate dehydrogenase subunit delta